MRNISEMIEQYLKEMLQQSQEGLVEIQRNELADQFQCVPSQINYVIGTRFTLEKGYIVESRRGGGGYIRIHKIKLPTKSTIHEHILQTVNESIDQVSAEGLIYQLEEADLITEREAKIMRAAVSRETITLKLPYRDQFRAKLMKSMLISLLRK